MSEFLINFGSWIWLGILILCLIIEGATWGLTTIWAAIAALPMIFIARTGLKFQWQVLIFVTLTLILLISTRPFAIKKLKNGKEKTNVNTMVGEEVLITKEISEFQKGEAKAKNGIIWSAKSSGNNLIKKNSICIIKEVQGNTIVVEEVNRDSQNC